MEDLELLREARERAAGLLEELRRQQAELAMRPDLRGVEAGERAMREAVDAAARMVESIEQALRSAGHPG